MGIKADQRSRSYNSFRNMIWGVFSKFATLLCPFILRTVIIYKLGSEYLGLGTLLTSILTVLNLAELGFGSAVAYSLYKPVSENDTDTICALVKYYKNVYRVIGFIVLGIGLACLPFLPKLVKGSYPESINIYYLFLIYLSNTVLSYWLFAYKNCLLTVTQRVDVSSRLNLYTSVLMHAIEAVVLLVFGNFYIYAIVAPIATIIRNLWRARVVDRMYPEYRPRGDLQEQVISAIKKRVAGIMVQKVCYVTRNSLDSIVISAFIGLQSVAIYGNYYFIMNGILGFLYLISASMLASIGNKVAVETPETNYADMNKFNFMFMMLSGFCTVCLACLYQPFMVLWMGTANLFSTADMLLMCLYFYLLTVGVIRYAYYEAAGLWWHGKWRAVAESATNLILNIVLGYYMGITGIILATTISLFAINFLYGTRIVYQHYFTMFKVTDHFKRQLWYFLATCVITAGAYYLTGLLPLGENTMARIGWMAVRIAICVVLASAVYILAFRNTEDYKAAKRWIMWRVVRVKAKLFRSRT